MSTATLPGRATYAVCQGNFGLPAPQVFKQASGAVSLKRVPVFRSGTFRDSLGFQATYDAFHIQQIVANNEFLTSRNILTGIPVRDGHALFQLVPNLPGTGQVIGWHTALYHESLVSPADGKTYEYLLADYDITDPQAAEKAVNGTYRHRSAEIVPYVTNDEAEFWPVYMGVAYVDLPAVEGLQFSRHNVGSGRTFVFFDGQTLEPKETGVTQSATTGAVAAAAAGPAQPVLGVTGQAQSFSVNGQAITDPVAVQNHITTLERAIAEQRQANRAAFVNGLATSGKILATQVESLTAFAGSLDDTQYASWTATYENAGSASLVANHVGGTATGGAAAGAGQPTQQSATDAQVATDLEVIKMHQRASMPKAQLEATASFKRLQAAGKAPTL